MMYFASVSRTAFDSRSDSNVAPLARSARHASSNAATRMRTSSGLNAPPAYLSMASRITVPLAAALPPIYDDCCGSPSLGSLQGTFQMSCAYSPTVRSEENHAIRAMFSMVARVQSEADNHSLSTLRCVAQ